MEARTDLPNAKLCLEETYRKQSKEEHSAAETNLQRRTQNNQGACIAATGRLLSWGLWCAGQSQPSET